MINETLAKIQRELKAPKSQYNAFGKYNYRNCEDILEAVKPLLRDACLKLEDEIVLIGDRYYVKATAYIWNQDGCLKATAFAREEEDKKGMDAAQVTGACSSYARKYTLNGLFLIDDSKDPDNDDNTGKEKKEKKKPQTEQKPPEKKAPERDVQDFEPPPNAVILASLEQIKLIQMMMKDKGITERQDILDALATFRKTMRKDPNAPALTSSKELTKEEASSWIDTQNAPGKC